MFLAVAYGPLVVSVLVAALAAGMARRSSQRLPTAVRVTTAIAMLIAVGLTVAHWLWGLSPWWHPNFSGPDGDLIIGMVRHIAPLVLGTVALVFLMLPPPIPGPRGSAALAPRNLLTYAPRGWLWVLTGVLALLALVTVLTGTLSSTDEYGRHVMYEIVSGTSSASTGIYGWWYSTRALIALAVLLAVLLIGLAVIARPAVGIDSERDALIRRTRSRNLLVVTCGAVLLHFAGVLSSLAGTSSLGLGFQSGSTGWISVGTSFAALGPVFHVANLVMLTAGLTMWWFVLLSVLLNRVRDRADPVAS